MLCNFYCAKTSYDMISRWCRAICHLYPMCTLGVLGQTRDSTSDIFIERKSAYVYFMSSSVIDMLYTGLIIHHRLYIISFEKFVCLFWHVALNLSDRCFISACYLLGMANTYPINLIWVSVFRYLTQKCLSWSEQWMVYLCRITWSWSCLCFNHFYICC